MKVYFLYLSLGLASLFISEANARCEIDYVRGVLHGEVRDQNVQADVGSFCTISWTKQAMRTWTGMDVTGFPTRAGDVITRLYQVGFVFKKPGVYRFKYRVNSEIGGKREYWDVNVVATVN